MLPRATAVDAARFSRRAPALTPSRLPRRPRRLLLRKRRMVAARTRRRPRRRNESRKCEKFVQHWWSPVSLLPATPTCCLRLRLRAAFRASPAGLGVVGWRACQGARGRPARREVAAGRPAHRQPHLRLLASGQPHDQRRPHAGHGGHRAGLDADDDGMAQAAGLADRSSRSCADVMDAMLACAAPSGGLDWRRGAEFSNMRRPRIRRKNRGRERRKEGSCN